MGRASIIPINHIGNIKMKISKPQDIERSAIRKLTLHIVPLMILLYFLAFLDRNNMAYAAKALEDNLGLTASAFGFASGIFFIGYFLFEIPSNAGTIKFGPRIWFARILISWGIFATLLGFVRTPLELYICRFMLGVCEAGFFPSVVYYFTVFFPEKYRTKISVCSSSSSRCPTPSARRFPALFSIFSMIGSGSLPGNCCLSSKDCRRSSSAC